MTPETKTAHTSGPWRWEHSHPDITVWGGGVEPDDEHVASVYGDGSIENAEANARLIAAAPKLYAAIAEAMPYLAETLGPCNPDCECLLHDLRAALTAADGQERER